MAVARKQGRPSWRLLLLVAGVIFVADRASKLAVIDWIALPEIGRLDVSPPYLNFVMAWNRGINFGLGSSADMRWLLVAVAVIISAGLAWWALRRGGAALLWGAGLVIGGALGNAYDRVRYGAVADFLNMSCCGIDNPFAFNIADVAIFAGALLIAYKA